MPYRNVYEEKNKRLSRNFHDFDEPEKDLKKIAEIYKSQMPSASDVASTSDRLKKHQERIENAKRANRGI